MPLLKTLKAHASFQILLFIVSLLLMGLSHAAFYPALAPVASVVALGLWVMVLLSLKDAYSRFYWGWIGSFALQLMVTYWLANEEAQGKYIYGVYFLLALIFGLQMGVWSYFLSEKRIKSYLSLLALSGFWVLLEGSRRFFFCGYMWDPWGLLLTFNLYSAQSLSLWGIYGLSFCFVFANLLFVRLLIYQEKFLETLSFLLVVVLLPYGYGYVRLQGKNFLDGEKERVAQVLLVQPSLSIEEKRGLGSKGGYLHPIDQWRHTLNLLKPYKEDKYQLIVLPEYFIPYEAYLALYPIGDVFALFQSVFGEELGDIFPPIEPFSRFILPGTKEKEVKLGKFVSNAYCAQVLSNLFDAEIIMGLDDTQIKGKEQKTFASVFHFQPRQIEAHRYDKRVLIPLAESLPFEWTRGLASIYGINGSFTPGPREGKVFEGRFRIAPMVCYEELFGEMIRSYAKEKVDAMVSVSNDAWYPNGPLPTVHYLHAKPRAIENGLPLIRSTNTGITSIIDAYGKEIAKLGQMPQSEWEPGVLQASVPLDTVNTFYSQYGDLPVFILSLLFCIGGLLKESRD